MPTYPSTYWNPASSVLRRSRRFSPTTNRWPWSNTSTRRMASATCNEFCKGLARGVPPKLLFAAPFTPITAGCAAQLCTYSLLNTGHRKRVYEKVIGGAAQDLSVSCPGFLGHARDKKLGT